MHIFHRHTLYDSSMLKLSAAVVPQSEASCVVLNSLALSVLLVRVLFTFDLQSSVKTLCFSNKNIVFVLLVVDAHHKIITPWFTVMFGSIVQRGLALSLHFLKSILQIFLLCKTDNLARPVFLAWLFLKKCPLNFNLFLSSVIGELQAPRFLLSDLKITGCGPIFSHQTLSRGWSVLLVFSLVLTNILLSLANSPNCRKHWIHFFVFHSVPSLSHPHFTLISFPLFPHPHIKPCHLSIRGVVFTCSHSTVALSPWLTRRYLKTGCPWKCSWAVIAQSRHKLTNEMDR